MGRTMQRRGSLMRNVLLPLVGSVISVQGRLVVPPRPPLGWNSFDLQFDIRTNATVPVWNETTFNQTARGLAAQLLQHGYDTIVIDGGWHKTIDAFGRNLPDTDRWPSAASSDDDSNNGFTALADFVHSLGLKLGIWTLRGVDPLAVQSKTVVKGTNYTVDQVVYNSSCPQSADQRWCTCTWDKNGVGLDPTHPGAQAYYNSVVDLYASWGVDFIKWDCMYDFQAGYSGEELLAVEAVKQADRDLVLSLSPGGGMQVDAAAQIAQDVLASMYRITGDFHAVNFDLDSHAFVVGNYSSLIGVNNTWPDLDMLDLGGLSPFYGTPRQYLHAALWLIARSPLMYTGLVPIQDSTTLSLVTGSALLVNQQSSGLQVEYRGDCSCTEAKWSNNNECTLNNHASNPDHSCVALFSASLGERCKAIAPLNIGQKGGVDVTVNFADVGLPAGSFTVEHAFAGLAKPTVTEEGFTWHAPSAGGALIIVYPESFSSAAQCV